MTRKPLRIIMLAGVILSSGCGNKSSTATCQDCGPYGDVLGAVCDYIDRCPDAVYPIAYRNRDECIAILNFALTCRLVDHEVGDTQTYTVERNVPEFNDAQADSCIAWLRDASCDAITQAVECGSEEPCEGEGGSSPCIGLLTPVEDDSDDSGAGPGESCEEDYCRSDLACSERTWLPDAGAYACQVCVPLLAEGELCSSTVIPCADGLVCRMGTGDSYLCQPLIADGLACQGSSECLSEFCHPTTRLCDPGGRDGDACLAQADCRIGFCDAGAGQCAPYKKNGEGCAADDQCANGSCDDATSICGLPDGSMCSSYDDAACASGNCDDATDTCIPGKANGETCEGNQECLSGYCNYSSQTCTDHCYSTSDCLEGQYCDFWSSICQSMKPDGSSCEDDEECLSGMCNMMTEHCGAKPGIGDPCGASYECYPEGYCEAETCVERKGPDESCDSYDACQEPFLCMDGRCRIMNLACQAGKAGEPCAYLRVCEEDAYCDMADGFTCKARKGAGETCGSSDECATSLMCSSDETQMVCMERKAAGETCTYSDECAEGLYCIFAESAYTCGAGPEGMPCDEYDAPCPEGYFCDDTCQPLRGPGEDCSSWEPCQEGLFCDTIDGCQPPRGQGEECQSNEPCAAGLYCDSDYVCQPRVGLGAACSPYYPSVLCLEDLYCDTGVSPSVCVQRLGTGAPCDEGEECLSNACDYSYGCLSTSECIMP